MNLAWKNRILETSNINKKKLVMDVRWGAKSQGKLPAFYKENKVEIWCGVFFVATVITSNLATYFIFKNL